MLADLIPSAGGWALPNPYSFLTNLARLYQFSEAGLQSLSLQSPSPNAGRGVGVRAKCGGQVQNWSYCSAQPSGKDFTARSDDLEH